MTNYVTGADVLEIMDTDLTSAQLDPFCEVANSIVTEKLTGIHAAERLKNIARWYAAHLVSCTPLAREAVSEKIGDAQATYSGQTWKGLEGTMYGQQVLLLDTSGILAQTGKKTCSFEVIN